MKGFGILKECQLTKTHPRGLTRNIPVARTVCAALRAASKSAVLLICRTVIMTGFEISKKANTYRHYKKTVMPVCIGAP